MMIILEGTDCSGKSTLAGQLATSAELDGKRVVKLAAGPPAGDGDDAMTEYELALLSHLRGAAMGRDTLVIADRWHLGELIYGPMLRGTCRLSMAQFWHIELYLSALGALRCVVGTDPVTLRTRYDRRGDALISYEQAVQAHLRFHDLAIDHHWERATSPASDTLVRDLLNLAASRCAGVQHLTGFPLYVGPPTPALLLVGDVPNAPGTYPAMLPRTYNSAHYLLDVLLAEGCRPEVHPYGLANANDGADVAALYRALGQPHVVGLGARAHATLDARSVPHAHLPHPQWQRRFRHHERAAYAHSLTHQENH